MKSELTGKQNPTIPEITQDHSGETEITLVDSAAIFEKVSEQARILYGPNPDPVIIEASLLRYRLGHHPTQE